VFGLGLSISFCAKTGSQAEQGVGDENAFRHLSESVEALRGTVVKVMLEGVLMGVMTLRD
jgi:hypothetical protein